MRLSRLVELCGISALIVGCVTPSALTKNLNHTTPPVSDTDRAACVQEVSQGRDQASIQGGYLDCLIAKGYATRLKTPTLVGMMPVVVKAPGGFTSAQVGKDGAACHQAATQKVANEHKSQAIGLAVTPGGGFTAAYDTVPDDVIATYLDCWRSHGYEAREHHEGEN